MPVETDDRRERMRQYRTLLVFAVVVVIFWLIWQSRGALFPFALGLVFSYLISPLINRVELAIPDRGWIGRSRRAIAVTLVYVTVLIVFIGLLATVIPPLANETTELVESLPEYAETAREESDYWNERYEEAIPEDARVWIEGNLDNAGSLLADASMSALNSMFGTVRRVLSFIFGLLLLPLWTFYVIKDQRRAMNYFYGLWPEGIQQDARNVVGIADRVLGAYIRGQIILGIIVGIVTFVGLTVLDVPFAAPLAILAGLFELIPILGP
ncbi:MAG: AI-2E family transporter, partial [Vicinamibacterales bacterium]